MRSCVWPQSIFVCRHPADPSALGEGTRESLGLEGGKLHCTLGGMKAVAVAGI